MAAYAAARTLVGEALDPESTTQLRKANDAMDKARRALSAGAGNIARTGSPGNMDALRRTNATRALAKALSHSLCNPGEETAALVRCWPRQMLSEVLRDMSAEERSDLLNHVVAAATALYGKSGNCDEFAAVTASYSEVQTAKRTHVITADVPFDHVWAESRHDDGIARPHDPILDSWLDGPPVLRENARFANAAEADQQHTAANDPRVSAAIDEMAHRLGKSPEAKELFDKAMDMSAEDIERESTDNFEPMSSMNDRFISNARRNLGKQQQAARPELLGDIQAVGVGRQFDLPIASATNKGNVALIRDQLETLTRAGASFASSSQADGSRLASRPIGLPTGPRMGLPSGPRMGLPSGPRPGLPSGPRMGLPSGPRPGLPSGPRMGLPSSPRAGLPLGQRPGLPSSRTVGAVAGPRSDGSSLSAPTETAARDASNI
ncbi:hypothetical protein [Burkholderia sp. Ax-1724]|uniref:hypothetical protein n=1 Tax=Burkholderia sp. Ax-1724 TaxID=2608336 RepID=UPI00141E5504|nr:hypothetical protein [Burkholderia sp. Ax-1724]NIF51325.1 hypothetical protein [Burkholderia sp. Ax-1724]